MENFAKSVAAARAAIRHDKTITTTITPHPIGLDDKSLDALLDHAHGIPIEWRARYLALVADELLPLEAITTAAVESACARVADRLRAKGRKGSDEDDRQLEKRLA